jgi:hypothetical protein
MCQKIPLTKKVGFHFSFYLTLIRVSTSSFPFLPKVYAKYMEGRTMKMRKMKMMMMTMQLTMMAPQ